PNPSSGRFTAAFNAEVNASLRVYALNGKLVRDLGSVTNQLAIVDHGIAPGIYLLVATTASERWTEKLIIR
ncbi:MAG: T9SS type A sorting domain-containing protein, partial [Bacteroidota bacterium]